MQFHIFPSFVPHILSFVLHIKYTQIYIFRLVTPPTHDFQRVLGSGKHKYSKQTEKKVIFFFTKNSKKRKFNKSHTKNGGKIEYSP